MSSRPYLHLSPSGYAVLESLEQLRLTAYPDSKGVWTIGYGHTGPEVAQGLVWTQEKAIHALQEDVMWAEKIVNDSAQVALNQNQFDALVLICFNIGSRNFQQSTLLVLLNREQYDLAAAQFDKWVYCDHQKVQGLVNRRAKERALFEQPIQDVA